MNCLHDLPHDDLPQSCPPEHLKKHCKDDAAYQLGRLQVPHEH